MALYPLLPPLEYVPWPGYEVEPNVFLATHLPEDDISDDLKTYIQKAFPLTEKTCCRATVTSVQIVEDCRALVFLERTGLDEASNEGKVHNDGTVCRDSRNIIVPLYQTAGHNLSRAYH